MNNNPEEVAKGHFLAAKENPMGEDVTERNTTPSRLRDGWIPEKLPHEDETLQQQSILKLTNHSWTSCDSLSCRLKPLRITTK